MSCQDNAKQTTTEKIMMQYDQNKSLSQIPRHWTERERVMGHGWQAESTSGSGHGAAPMEAWLYQPFTAEPWNIVGAVQASNRQETVRRGPQASEVAATRGSTISEQA
jgi:hypothetical protein